MAHVVKGGTFDEASTRVPTSPPPLVAKEQSGPAGMEAESTHLPNESGIYHDNLVETSPMSNARWLSLGWLVVEINL